MLGLVPEAGELVERERGHLLAARGAGLLHAAEAGDVVTLSPACAAFDQFKNFAVRGRAYKELVGSLT